MMRRARPCILASLMLGGCGLQPLYGGGSGGAVAAHAALGARSRRSPASRAGWCATSSSTGSAKPVAGPAISARRHARRQYHRVRPSRRPRRDAGAPDACAPATSSSMLRTERCVLDATAGSDAGIDIVSSRICDRRRRADRAREPGRHRRRPDRRAARRLRRAHDAQRSEGEQGLDRPVGRPARPEHPLLSFPRARRSAVARARRAAAASALGATQARGAFRCGEVGRRPARRRSCRDEPVRRQRAIWIEPAGNDIADGVEALLERPPPRCR